MTPAQQHALAVALDGLKEADVSQATTRSATSRSGPASILPAVASSYSARTTSAGEYGLAAIVAEVSR